MDVNVIMQAISTVGFPICACGALFWLVNKMSEQHRQEVGSLRDVLDRNTAALIELKTLFSDLRKGE